MGKRVLIPLADGFEEIEAFTCVDVLRRAKLDVVTAAIGDDLMVSAAHAVNVKCDKLICDCIGEKWDAVVVPGGMPGSKNCAASEDLKSILKETKDSGRMISAICAAPAVVLAEFGLLTDTKATCYPAPVFLEKIPFHLAQRVVVSRNCITSQGPGTAMEFALALVGALVGEKVRNDLSSAMIVE